MKTYESLIHALEGEKPIVLRPVYVRIMGSVQGGIALGQMVYWASAMKGKQFWKTDKGFTEETCLGEDSWRSAKSKMRDLNIISFEIKGMPARTYYVFNFEKLLELIIQHPTSYCQNGVTSTPETPPTTSESTSESIKYSEVLKKAPSPSLPKKKFKAYDEAASFEEYSVDIDGEESADDGAPAVSQSVLKKYREMLDWSTKRRGFAFFSPPKQYKAFALARRKDISPGRMQERWTEFEGDKFREENGFDWMDVVMSFNKRS